MMKLILKNRILIWDSKAMMKLIKGIGKGFKLWLIRWNVKGWSHDEMDVRMFRWRVVGDS